MLVKAFSIMSCDRSLDTEWLLSTLFDASLLSTFKSRRFIRRLFFYHLARRFASSSHAETINPVCGGSRSGRRQ